MPQINSVSQSETKRPLMLPQKLKIMPFEPEILLINGEHPIKCQQALYFNDHFFMNKLIPLFPLLQAIAARSTKLPSKVQLAIALNNEELAVKIS
ncbi:type IV secretory system conjugative DNA transfer family protein [Candidatus Tisiphia endosymbiont of Nemotelus uliginosus]|uniref:type IV secretory system conjugative DNA transfer family protein n=1 Tax=Candidatus Tisiphia endosymbiont of Nemotelus uliginosus TaxID=3077926 RepID=UPI0035C91E3E